MRRAGMVVVDVLSKVKILSDAAKYDASCASSGSQRESSGGTGNTVSSGICHSWSDDGRCISLLKLLFSNSCIYDCAYCVNRSSNDIPRTSFTPEELADLTINFYRRNYIEGLFLSSAVVRNPSYTMEQLLQTVRLLREEHKFRGYIHLKAIPGAEYELIHEAGRYADRMSVNIELPSNRGLQLLAPQKKRQAILEPMSRIDRDIVGYSDERKHFGGKTPSFVPAGQSTQLIVGATPDDDRTIIHLTNHLYRNFHLKRVYYSAYMPISSHPVLSTVQKPPLLREHRLYQADWLLRFYGFSVDDILDDCHSNLDLELDPKVSWALRNLHQFPIEVNRASYWMLLRIPGIGVKSAKRILEARRVHSLDFDELRKIGVVLKRARHFVTCKGKYYSTIGLDDTKIRRSLIDRPLEEDSWQQLSLFAGLPAVPDGSGTGAVRTGEI